MKDGDDGNDSGAAKVAARGWYAFERLEVYHLAVEFRRLVQQIIRELPPGFEDDAEQVDRSSKSSVRNICEGSGEFKPLEKARFYRMSLRSAQESGGTLRLLEAEGCTTPLFAEAHAVNHKLIAKLTVMIKHKTKRA